MVTIKASLDFMLPMCRALSRALSMVSFIGSYALRALFPSLRASQLHSGENEIISLKLLPHIHLQSLKLCSVF